MRFRVASHELWWLDYPQALEQKTDKTEHAISLAYDIQERINISRAP